MSRCWPLHAPVTHRPPKVGKLEFFDLRTLERQDEMMLGAGIRLAQFNRDGSRLVLLTADQMVRVIDATAIGRATRP